MKAWELLPLSVKEVSPNTQDTDNEATAHALLYIWIYSEHERFVAYYSRVFLKLAISFDKNNMVNASNYLICNALGVYQNNPKDVAKLMNNL